MKTLLLSAATLVWLAACGPRGENRGDRSATNETGMRGDTTAVAPGGAGPGDTISPGRAGVDSSGPAGILTVLSTANLQEIQESRYAEQHASSAAVKALARRLEADHRANLKQLRQVAKELAVSEQLPSDTGAGPTSEPADLMGRQGADFDRAFVQHEIEAHEANIDRIRNQMIPAAQDAKVKQYLEQTVTAMEGHLQRARQVERQLGGGGGGDSMSRSKDSVSRDADSIPTGDSTRVNP